MVAECNMPESLPAERQQLATDGAGRVDYYLDASASGEPLLVLHSINASPTAMEVAPLFEHYRGTRPVYALELPGFGFSERGDKPYSPELYADTINSFIASVIGRSADVVALSTTSEFIARAALQAPEHFRSLVLVSPTGMGSREPPSETARQRLDKLFGTPVLAPALYRLLTSRFSIRYFLNMSFQDKAPVELIDQACETTRQPGASYAPFAFLSMKLFTTRAVEELYLPLQRPSLVLYDQDPNVSFDRLHELLASNTAFEAKRIGPAQGMPHWDEPTQTFEALDDFWSSARVTEGTV